MTVTAFMKPDWLSPAANRAVARCRWYGLISPRLRPLRGGVGVKIQFMRSSFSKAQTALVFCSGVSDTRNRLAASVITEMELVRLYAEVSRTTAATIAARRTRFCFMRSSLSGTILSIIGGGGGGLKPGAG